MLGLCATSQAALYNSDFMNGGVIPDANLSGWSDTRNISGLSGTISAVQVTLNTTGGFNGDLYAYLSFNGTLVPLLTRVGSSESNPFGYSSSGMVNLVLVDGAPDVHLYGGGALTGTYAPDGRVLDTTTMLPGTGVPSTLASFNGASPNGDWTLFFADVSSGDQSTVTSWSLDIITAVPEPINVALGVFAGLFLIGSVCRSERVRKLFAKPQPVDLD